MVLKALVDRQTASWYLRSATAGAILMGIAVVACYQLDLLPPVWLRRQATVSVLWLLFALYLVAAAAAVVGTPWLVFLLARRQTRSMMRLRALAACLSVLCGVIVLEGASSLRQVAARRLSDLPVRFPERAQPNETYVVVIGESSARGEPYHPWLSVGQIAGWALEGVFPGQRFRVDVLAEGGLNLKQAVHRLRGLRRRPDAILVYCGHNEFLGRYAVSGMVWHYADEDVPPAASLPRLAGRWSPVCRLIDECMELQRLPLPPPPNRPRELIDHPVCTDEERAAIRDSFRAGLEGLVAYCERIRALPILVIPPGNDGGYPPNRSVLTPETVQRERAAAERDFLSARSNEADEPAQSAEAYRRLLAWQPTFAEAHYRLAALLARSGDWEQAAAHYTAARDADGMPLRCPTDFQQVYRDLAASRPAIVLVDGPGVLSAVSPHHLLDDNLFHDPQHPILAGYVALAQELLKELKAHRAFGWPESVPVPSLRVDQCAAHFRLGSDEWALVCERTAAYYSRAALMRYDPSESLRKQERYGAAARAIADGLPPEQTGITGVGCAVPKPFAPANAHSASR